MTRLCSLFNRRFVSTIITSDNKHIKKDITSVSNKNYNRNRNKNNNRRNNDDNTNRNNNKHKNNKHNHNHNNYKNRIQQHRKNTQLQELVWSKLPKI